MLLIFDEADSFLRDRRHAQRNFEVAWVNEMLTQMESHPLKAAGIMFYIVTNILSEDRQKDLGPANLDYHHDMLLYC